MAEVRCTFRVPGLDCSNEVASLRAALDDFAGVRNLAFDLSQGLLTANLDTAYATPASVAARIAQKTGMKAEPVESLELYQPGWWQRNARWLLTAVSGAAVAAGVLVSQLGGSYQVPFALYLVAIAAGAAQLVPKALLALRALRLDIHVLMTVAILGAIALGQWDEAATVAFLFGLSEALEAFSLERARRAVRSLLEVAPETAELIGAGGEVRVVPAQELRQGDHVRVRAGERIPIDGRVVLGRSSVDQKAITGESIPILREPGDDIYAGTINGEGALEVEAARPLGDAVVSRIIERVRLAQAGRTPIERSIDRFAAVYTPAVVIFGLLIMLGPPLILTVVGIPAGAAVWRSWFTRGLVLLVIACPCALVIATPVAIVSALAAAARRGILIKGGQFLEAFAGLRVLALDKTGTLTRGEPDVVEVVPATGREGADVLRIAAALGDRGGHVLGRAIARHARGLRLDVPVAQDYRAVPGLGATGRVDATQYHIGSHRYIDEAGLCHEEFHASLGEAESSVGTAVALTAPSGPVGWIRLADRPRPEAAAVLKELNRLGLETVMLTGDNVSTAKAMARELGITDTRANLLPADKVTAVTELDAQRGPTGMIGDGVNDAPALAAARVSVSLGGISSASAVETADIVLMADDLTGLPWLVRHSRRTLARIRQNIGLAVGMKAAVMILAILNLATLWMAIVADVGTSLFVVANALRLLRSR
jgi:Cd2+/Zn2+-exporting ATPase